MHDERQPCETCPYHELQSGRVDTMWGAGKILIAVLGIIIGIIFTGQLNNTGKIEMNTSRIASHERTMAEGMHQLEKVITIMSVNQKRQMEDAGIRYIDPAPIVYGSEFDADGQ